MFILLVFSLQGHNATEVRINKDLLFNESCH